MDNIIWDFYKGMKEKVKFNLYRYLTMIIEIS